MSKVCCRTERFWSLSQRFQAPPRGMRRAVASLTRGRSPAMRNEDSYGIGDDPVGTDENPGVVRAARKAGEGLRELGRALSDTREGVVEPLAGFIQERPLAAVGIAFGVGYLLAGGLFSRTTGRLLGLGWRLGGMALAKNLFANLSGTEADL